MSAATGILIALLFGWGVPWLGMRMTMPSLERSGRRARNYRGREVTMGLGLVWVFWVAGVRVGGSAGASAALAEPLGEVVRAVAIDASALTVIWAMLFGLIDDAYGSSEEKGFRGHLRALFRGRMSTGSLKLLGIGFVAVAAGLAISVERYGSAGSNVRSIATWILAAAVVALTANLVNLLDLRPGRALKGYLLVGALAATACALWSASGGARVGVGLVTAGWILGPALAVWRYDLGEEGMLGDAGANAAGALVGFVLAFALPLAGLAGAAAVLGAVNLLSERVSFSAAIENSPVLSRIDLMGRTPESRDSGDLADG